MTCGFWFLGPILVGAIFYYGAVLLGLYKDSLMAHFRHYGEEQRIYPLPRFMLALGAFIMVLTPMLVNSLTGAAFVAFAAIVIIASAAIGRLPQLQASLPRWYFSLLTITTREERRAIAYAWMRLPFKTRLRLNGDSYAFQIFIDEMRLTVIYGARDPDDPWAAWQ
jgi:hypothetical protein